MGGFFYGAERGILKKGNHHKRTCVKSLPTLIKLASQRVRNQRLRLGEFEKKDKDLNQQMTVLRENLKFEADRARMDPMLGLQYGRYAQQVEGQIAKIMFAFEENKKRLFREQDRLAVLFKEQKVLEIYKDQQNAKIVKEQEAQEQKNMDELASRLKRKRA